MSSKAGILSRNILVNFLSQAIIFITAFFTTPYILKTLGETNYSLLVFLTTIVGFFLALDFGLSPAFVQAFSEKTNDKKRRGQILGTSFILYLSLSLFWSLLIFISSPFIMNRFFPIAKQVGNQAVFFLRLFSIVLFFNAMGSFITFSFQALQKFHLANLRAILVGFLVPIGTVYLLMTNKGIENIIYWHLFVHIVVGLFLSFLLKREGVLNNISFFSGGVGKRLFGFAKWKFLAQFAGQIRQKAARFFLSANFSLSQLAYFVIPQNISDRYLSLLPNIISPIFPMVASLKGEEKSEALDKLYRQSMKLINIFLLPIGIFIFFYAAQFLSLWISPEFSQKAATVLKILILGMSLSVLNGLPMTFLEGLGKPAMPAAFSIVIVILYLLFSWILIPPFGIVGAALVYCFTYALQVPVFLYIASKRLIKKKRKQFFLNSYFLPIALAILTGLFLSQFKEAISSWPLFIIHFLLYWFLFAFLVFVFKLIGKEEKEILKLILKKAGFSHEV